MVRVVSLAALALVCSIACASRADEPPDPKSLYRLDTSGTTTAVKPNEQGKLVLAITPTVPGSHVKPETPFKGKLSATGPIVLSKTEIAFKDHARIVGDGPVFEIPFQASAAGASEVAAELTFFVCTEQACLRTTEKVKVPVAVQ